MRDWERYLWLVLMGPVLWMQGKYVRKVTPRLAEPEGPREGVSGKGPALRLLIAGDSAAAGVGACTQGQALCGQLVQRLSQRFTVRWKLMAITGLDSPGLKEMLETVTARPLDVVVLSIGVNDVTNLMMPCAWVRWQERLAEHISASHAPKLLVHSAVPPMRASPHCRSRCAGSWADGREK